MIVLDTNVISELVRTTPDPAVMQWLAAQREPELHITAMTAAELLDGVLRLPRGARRSALVATVAKVLESDFAGRVLSFSAESALDYADIVTTRRAAGNPVGAQDAIIAAVTRCHGATLATRNTRDFSGVGVPLINPWRP